MNITPEVVILVVVQIIGFIWWLSRIGSRVGDLEKSIKECQALRDQCHGKIEERERELAEGAAHRSIAIAEIQSEHRNLVERYNDFTERCDDKQASCRAEQVGRWEQVQATLDQLRADLSGFRSELNSTTQAVVRAATTLDVIMKRNGFDKNQKP